MEEFPDLLSIFRGDRNTVNEPRPIVEERPPSPDTVCGQSEHRRSLDSFYAFNGIIIQDIYKNVMTDVPQTKKSSSIHVAIQ